MSKCLFCGSRGNDGKDHSIGECINYGLDQAFYLEKNKTNYWEPPKQDMDDPVYWTTKEVRECGDCKKKTIFACGKEGHNFKRSNLRRGDLECLVCVKKKKKKLYDQFDKCEHKYDSYNYIKYCKKCPFMTGKYYPGYSKEHFD